MISHQEKTVNLECTYCHNITPLRDFKGECPVCGEKIVEARYDLSAINLDDWKRGLRKRRHPGLWRYHEVLPIYDTGNIVSLHEGSTPLIKSEALGTSLGLKNLYIKDE